MFCFFYPFISFSNFVTLCNNMYQVRNIARKKDAARSDIPL